MNGKTAFRREPSKKGGNSGSLQLARINSYCIYHICQPSHKTHLFPHLCTDTLSYQLVKHAAIREQNKHHGIIRPFSTGPVASEHFAGKRLGIKGAGRKERGTEQHYHISCSPPSQKETVQVINHSLILPGENHDIWQILSIFSSKQGKPIFYRFQNRLPEWIRWIYNGIKYSLPATQEPLSAKMFIYEDVYVHMETKIQ